MTSTTRQTPEPSVEPGSAPSGAVPERANAASDATPTSVPALPAPAVSEHPRRVGSGEAQVQELVAVPKGRRPWVVLVAILLVVAIVAAGASYLASGSGRESTNDAYV